MAKIDFILLGAARNNPVAQSATMPNWCCNTVIVEGTKDAITPFRKTLRSGFSLHHLVPIPEEVHNRPAEQFNQWLTENWGTIDDANRSEIHTDVDETTTTPTGETVIQSKIILQFDTRWNPVIPWAKHCQKKFPQLRVTVAYCEFGNAFYGRTTFEENTVVAEKFNFTAEDTAETSSAGPFSFVEPAGKLKEFMNTYYIAHMGG